MKIKIGLTQFVKLQTTILSGLIILIMMIFGFFIYKNFFKTLSDTQRLISIREQVSTEKINITLFNQVSESVKNKKTVPEVDWTTFKNPFLSYEIEQE